MISCAAFIFGDCCGYDAVATPTGNFGGASKRVIWSVDNFDAPPACNVIYIYIIWVLSECRSDHGYRYEG